MIADHVMDTDPDRSRQIRISADTQVIVDFGGWQ
jgi:hypothetical protein